MTGAAVTQVRDGIYLVDVLFRATDEERISLSTLRNLQFALPSGRTVPLGQFATLDFEREFPLIWRRDGVPTLTVQADVTRGASPEAVIAALAPAVAKSRGAFRNLIISPSAARSRRARDRKPPSLLWSR
jgi:multidrug efflux pump subunit AcrB